MMLLLLAIFLTFVLLKFIPLFSGSVCWIPPLNGMVTATPIKSAYQIGESVSLSCPAESVLEGGVSEMICSPSLQWSPSPDNAHCKAGTVCFLSVLNFKVQVFNQHQEKEFKSQGF